MRIYWAFVGNRYSRELFIVPVWRKSWWQGVWYEIRWYLFLAKRPSADIGHNPIAQAAMFGYFLMSVFMIITGFALYSEHSQYAIFAPFRYVVEFFYWTGSSRGHESGKGILLILKRPHAEKRLPACSLWRMVKVASAAPTAAHHQGSQPQQAQGSCGCFRQLV